jgi:hypothetical protein
MIFAWFSGIAARNDVNEALPRRFLELVGVDVEIAVLRVEVGVRAVGEVCEVAAAHPI